MTAATDRVRRAALFEQRARAIILDAGPGHPEFGHSFLRVYLSNYARHPESRLAIPPAGWHVQFHSSVFRGLGSGEARVYLAPRGFAKSVTASLVLPLAALALRLKEFVWIVSDTSTQAKQLMAAVIHELDTNERLLADFPHLRRLLDSRNRPVADRDDDVILQSGARIQALGAGQRLRGRRQGEHRPDLVVIDDLESEDSVATRARRDKLDQWLSSSLMGALGPNADVVMVGTLLHHDAVLARLMARDGWHGRTYPAVTDPSDYSTTTWPELWPAERLEAARCRMGSLAFAREMLHNPIDDETAMFRREHLRFRDTRSRLLEAAPSERPSARVRIAVDPAISQKASADYSAIAVVCRIGSSPEIDVLDVWRGRVTGSELARRVAATADQWAGFHPVVVSESVAAQAWLAQALREQHGLAVREVRPSRDKVHRAEPLAVRFENGEVWLSPHLKDGPFAEELLQFPAGEHDDMVDACVYAAGDLTARATPRVRRL